MATVKKTARKSGKVGKAAKVKTKAKQAAVKAKKPAAAKKAAPASKPSSPRPAARTPKLGGQLAVDAAQISPSAPAPAAPSAAATGGRPPFVLIVDDFADAREMYAEYFEFLHYRVATAENGLEAIEKATAHRPDVILMDLSLPVLDGWEATRRLKRDDRTRHIPVIALTGNALAGHEEHARKAGCDSFLTKPCLPEDVEREIQRILVEARRSVA